MNALKSGIGLPEVLWHRAHDEVTSPIPDSGPNVMWLPIVPGLPANTQLSKKAMLDVPTSLFEPPRGLRPEPGIFSTESMAIVPSWQDRQVNELGPGRPIGRIKVVGLS